MRIFADLWTEDVVEIFFWPDEEMPVYFEYELSPRNYELPILVPNKAGSFLGWRPWKYEGERARSAQNEHSFQERLILDRRVFYSLFTFKAIDRRSA